MAKLRSLLSKTATLLRGGKKTCPSTMSKSHPLLTAWTLGSAVGIFFPITVLVGGVIFRTIWCNKNYNSQWCYSQGGYWGGNHLVAVSVFVWCYLLFLWLAVYGHGVLSRLCSRGNENSILGTKWRRVMCTRDSSSDAREPYDLGFLTGAVILFGNLTFLLGLMLSVPLGGAKEHLFRRSTIIPFAFLLWAIFCLIFSCWLIQFQPSLHEYDESGTNYKSVDERHVVSSRNRASQTGKSRERSRERTTNDMQTDKSAATTVVGRGNDQEKRKNPISAAISRVRGRSRSKERLNGGGSNNAYTITPVV